MGSRNFSALALTTTLGLCLLLPAHAAAPRPVEPGPDWWAAARGSIARSEYRPSLAGGNGDYSHGAPNRAHGFRTRFGPAGIEIVPRDGGGDDWRLALSLVSIGRGDELRPVDAAALSVDDARVVLARGAITEWYENAPRGLEQFFEVAVAPPPAAPRVRGPALPRPDDDGGLALPATPPPRSCPAGDNLSRAPLCLVLEHAGDLQPRPGDGGGALEFSTPDRRATLRYAGLVVHDATGRALPARLALADGAVLIVVDDEGAAYPVTVDPLFTTAAWTFDGTQEGGELGTSVATAGDVNGDGYSDVLVAAPSFDDGQLDEGRVFVFLGSASGLAASPAWQADGNQAGALFGSAVATAGDVNGDGYSDVAIGAPGHDTAYPDEGTVRVYHGGTSGLASTAAWAVTGRQAGARLGSALASAGDPQGDGYSDLVVCAPYYDNGQVDEGRAQMYAGSPTGLGVGPVWTAESNEAGARFGSAVAWAGDVNGDGRADVIVGAPLADHGQVDEGRAFVYLGTATGLATTAAWNAESNQAGARFGSAVTTAGDVDGDGYADVAVGAPDHDTGAFGETGRVLVFPGGATGPATTPSWSMDGAEELDRFGAAITTAGDVNGDGYADLAVGVPGAEQGSGAVHVYQGGAAGLTTLVTTRLAPGEPGARFGASVALAGDVDGDGFSDLAVGWPGVTSGASPEGRATLHRGASDGLSDVPAWTRDEAHAGGQFGFSVAGAGDVDNDGFDDVLVGAPYFDTAGPAAGRAFLFRGLTGGLATTPSWFVDGAPGAILGYSLAGGFDINADGYGDVAIGSPGHPGGGRGDIYFGGPGGLSASPGSSVVAQPYDGGALGHTTAVLGDIDGDGIEEVAFGAPYGTPYGSEYELGYFVYTFRWNGALFFTSPIAGFQGGERFSWSIAGAGDTNRDGFDDIVVGAPRYSRAEGWHVGRLFVYHGSPAGIGQPVRYMYLPQPEGRFGEQLAGAGDVDGDGYADVVVGSPYVDDAASADTGRVDLLFGAPEGLSASHVATVFGEDAGANLGAVVAPAGDVEGDGYSEFLVGAPGFDPGAQPGLGRLALHRGAPGRATFPSRGWTTYGAQPGQRWPTSAALAGDVDADGDPDVVVGSAHFLGAGADSGRARLFLANGAGTTLRPLQRDTAGTRIDAGAASRQASVFQVSAIARSTFGPTRARVEIEVKAAGQRLDGTALTRGATERNTGLSGVEVAETLSANGVPARRSWRIRSWFSRSAHPLQPHGRWASLGDTGLATPDLAVFAPCVDGDGDGYGNAPTPLCAAGRTAADCDDANPLVSPYRGQACDGVNNDCADPAWPEIPPSEFDADGDGNRICAGDCDDADPSVYRWAPQLCDGKDNDCVWPGTPANEADNDSDGVRICAGDCDDGDAVVWALPGTIGDLAFAGDRVTLTWTAPAPGTNEPLSYDTLRSERPDDFAGSGVCVESDDASNTRSVDALTPSTGHAFFYLVRSENVCGGAMGRRSDGTPRSGRPCP